MSCFSRPQNNNNKILPLTCRLATGEVSRRKASRIARTWGERAIAGLRLSLIKTPYLIPKGLPWPCATHRQAHACPPARAGMPDLEPSARGRGRHGDIHSLSSHPGVTACKKLALRLRRCPECHLLSTIEHEEHKPCGDRRRGRWRAELSIVHRTGSHSACARRQRVGTKLQHHAQAPRFHAAQQSPGFLSRWILS